MGGSIFRQTGRRWWHTTYGFSNIRSNGYVSQRCTGCTERGANVRRGENSLSLHPYPLCRCPFKQYPVRHQHGSNTRRLHWWVSYDHRSETDALRRKVISNQYGFASRTGFDGPSPEMLLRTTALSGMSGDLLLSIQCIWRGDRWSYHPSRSHGPRVDEGTGWSYGSGCQATTLVRPCLQNCSFTCSRHPED